MKDSCKYVLFYENSNKEYGFLTTEASNTLDEYLQEIQKDGEKFSSDSFIIRAKYHNTIEKTKPMTADTVKQSIDVLTKLNASKTKIGNRYDIQVAHCIRKRFTTSQTE